MHVVGGSGKGKSKLLEHMIRQDIAEGRGVCVVDWHGELYNNIVRWCHTKDVGLFGDYREVVLLNPSEPDYISTFNPFYGRHGEDPAALSSHAESLIGVILRAWGATSSDEMPSFERICRAVFHFMLETSEALPNASRLLEFDATALRDYAIRAVNNPSAGSTWRELRHIKRFDDWQAQTLSTKNRLTRFVGSTGVRRFMGLRRSDVEIANVVEKQKIVLVNLGESKYLTRESAALFAAILLREFFSVAMERANLQSRAGITPQPYSLYLDEFQEYINEDMAAMLDQVRKGGLHMVLAHQHFGHFWENPRLRKSVLINARIRAVFGGLDYEDASAIANEMCLEELNTRQVKKAYYSHYTVYEEETRVHRSRSESENWSDFSGTGSGSASGSGSSFGSGESFSSAQGFPEVQGLDPIAEKWLTEMAGSTSYEAESSYSVESSSEIAGTTKGGSKASSEAVVPFLNPVTKEQLSSETEWTREEKLSKIAEVLKYQPERHCFIRLDTKQTEPVLIPPILLPHIESKTLDEYEATLYHQQGCLSAAEVDRLLFEDGETFLERANTLQKAHIVTADATDDDEFADSSSSVT